MGGSHSTTTLPETGGDRSEVVMRLKDLLNAQTVIEHHAESCISHNIYPLGLKTFVPCVAYKSNNKLRRQWQKVLHNTSIELLALCKQHFQTLANENTEKLEQVEKTMEKIKDEKRRKEWEEKKIELVKASERSRKEMKKFRDGKLKHALRVHKKGKIFVENCLREREESRPQATLEKTNPHNCRAELNVARTQECEKPTEKRPANKGDNNSDGEKSTEKGKSKQRQQQLKKVTLTKDKTQQKIEVEMGSVEAKLRL